MTNKKKSLNNVTGAILANIANILISFFAQRIFLHILNAEYLGLNGLFSNVISMLGIFELGIGSAITFSLYKPLVNNDKQKIKALMNFYRRAYRIIACVVTVTGLAIMPFLNLLIKEVTIDVNIYIIYLLFLADVICSYLLSYRRNILYADKKNYQISYTHIGYLATMNTLQLTLLYLTKNYYLYLGVKVVMRIIENLVIHRIVHRQYSYLDDISGWTLDKTSTKEILKKVRALLFHKIGGFIILGSDNLIISKFIGLVEVGLYSNYYLIIQAANNLIGQAITALTPTIGHKLAMEYSERSFSAFSQTRMAGFVLACLAAVLFFNCIQPFITIWLGDDYVLDLLVVAMLSFNMFQKLQRYPYMAFKEAAGIYHEDRFVPLVESTLNIVASIILLHFFGLAGVFMGTIISGLALWCYSYPRFVYKKLFKRYYSSYIYETLGYILIFLTCLTVSYLVTNIMICESALVQLMLNALMSISISLLIIIVSLCKTESYRYIIETIETFQKKFKSKFLIVAKQKGV